MGDYCSDDRFPIMGAKAGEWFGAIPFDLIANHEAYAQVNHKQSLIRLRERGGLSPCEAVAVLQDRRMVHMNDKEALDRLCELAGPLLPLRAPEDRP